MTALTLTLDKDSFLFNNYAANVVVKPTTQETALSLVNEYVDLFVTASSTGAVAYVEHSNGGYTPVTLESLEYQIQNLSEGEILHSHGPEKVVVTQVAGVVYAGYLEKDEVHLAELHHEIVNDSDVVETMKEVDPDEYNSSAGDSFGTIRVSKEDGTNVHVKLKDFVVRNGSNHIEDQHYEATHSEEEIRKLISDPQVTEVTCKQVITYSSGGWETTFTRLGENQWKKVSLDS